VARVTRVALPALLAGACGTRTAAPDFDTDDAVEAAAAAAQIGALDAMIVAPVRSADPEAAVSALVASPLGPGGCATARRDPTRAGAVVVHLDACSEPFAAYAWTGDISVVFGAGASGALSLQAMGTGITADSRAVTYQRSGTLVVSDATQTLSAAGTWTYFGSHGVAVVHATTAALLVDPLLRCRWLNGAATTAIGTRRIDSTLEDYRVCQDSAGFDRCPVGTATHVDGTTGDTVVFTFDGTSHATIVVNPSAPDAGPAQVPLICGR
jgi:hypothetical protein